MLERMGRRLFSVLLVVALAASLIGAAAENAQVMEEVRRLAWPYYEAAIRIAAMSTDLGRDFTDHKTAHAEMVAEKSVEVGHAIQKAVAMGKMGGEDWEGRVALNGEIDFMTLEGAALFHDTGMCGGGYAMTETTDSNGSPMMGDDGRKLYDLNAAGLYLMHPERDENFAEIRSFHSLNSGLYVLVNREGLRKAGYTDTQVDKMAAACMAHSKSNSGVRNLNSKADWTECFNRLDSIVYAWNKSHPGAQITFDRTPFEADDILLGALASETLALRVGDVSRDSGPDAEVQTGERVHVERSTLNDRGGSIPEEIRGAEITVGENNDTVESEKSRQVHAGEQNITHNRTFYDASGVVTHEITVADGCSAPRCTQQAIDDHLGEFYSARDEWFQIRIVFERFDAEDADFFRDSWEDFRVQAAQDYPTIAIGYPWDGEVSK
ncbi:MAG: hypothetical protein IJH09_00225 [Clostridia bacterium]|nr:hypothetical protein [Clostridia bacterium]